MEAILTEETFVEFGFDALMPHQPAPTLRLDCEDGDQLRRLVRTTIPKQPGVYGMLDAIGRLIYVGKSKALRNRLLSYFLPNCADEKAGRIIQATCSLVWETQPSEFAALLREQYLIRSFQPRFNVQGMPNRQKPGFLCLGKAPAHCFFVSPQPDPSMKAWEGPLFGTGRLKRAADILNRIFRLRDCSNQTKFYFSDQLSLFENESKPGCLRHEIGTCLGPCIQGCSRTAYVRSVDEAQQFLAGHTERVIEELEATMHLSADRLHFENAARLREDLKVARWLSRRLAEHSKARQTLTCIYPVKGCDGRDIWYLIRRGVVEHAVPAPANGRFYAGACRTAKDWFGQGNHIGAGFSRREETLAIVNLWFRTNPDQRKKLLYFDSLPQRYAELQTAIA
jgi:excinuclease ABC subunit C